VEENARNATTQQFRTAKISGCALKPGEKTRSSLRQTNLQLQNEAALMSCPIRAVEHRCAGGLAGAFVKYRSPANFQFSFFLAETLSNA